MKKTFDKDSELRKGSRRIALWCLREFDGVDIEDVCRMLYFCADKMAEHAGITFAKPKTSESEKKTPKGNIIRFPFDL